MLAIASTRKDPDATEVSRPCCHRGLQPLNHLTHFSASTLFLEAKIPKLEKKSKTPKTNNDTAAPVSVIPVNVACPATILASKINHEARLAEIGTTNREIVAVQSLFNNISSIDEVVPSVHYRFVQSQEPIVVRKHQTYLSNL